MWPYKLGVTYKSLGTTWLDKWRVEIHVSLTLAAVTFGSLLSTCTYLCSTGDQPRAVMSKPACMVQHDGWWDAELRRNQANVLGLRLWNGFSLWGIGMILPFFLLEMLSRGTCVYNFPQEQREGRSRGEHPRSDQKMQYDWGGYWGCSPEKPWASYRDLGILLRGGLA